MLVDEFGWEAKGEEGDKRREKYIKRKRLNPNVARMNPSWKTQRGMRTRFRKGACV